jgi:hypothetical protein
MDLIRKDPQDRPPSSKKDHRASQASKGEISGSRQKKWLVLIKEDLWVRRASSRKISGLHYSTATDPTGLVKGNWCISAKEIAILDKLPQGKSMRLVRVDSWTKQALSTRGVGVK